MGTVLGLAAPSPAGVPSPQRLGYSSVVLDRLARYACSVLAFEQAWVAVRLPGNSRGFVVVAGAGTDPDLIGQRVHAAGLGAVAAAPVLAGEALGHHEHRELSAGDSQAEIRALVKALAEADGDTYRHSLEVAATAKVVGERLGLARAEIVEVELGALLHDVGKLRLPPHILGKQGRLTEHERRLVRLHPEWGAEMVGHIPGLEAVALIVRLHHERPDGSGYPHGLSHERIPVASRIVSVCDAYGAMTKRRPYSEPLDVDTALLELSRHAGTQFDQDAVEALASFVRCAEAVPA